MTLLSTLSGLLSILTFCFHAHPIHVSVTEIEFDQKDQALEIMMRVFMDDLELTLRNDLKEPQLDILNPGNKTSVDGLVKQYLKDHFTISLDNQIQKTNYLGHEREGQAFIFYIEVTDVQPWKTITIRNDIIMSTHGDQSNIIHVFKNDEVRSLRLTRNTPVDKLTFE
jgi:hypothetical protein